MSNHRQEQSSDSPHPPCWPGSRSSSLSALTLHPRPTSPITCLALGYLKSVTTLISTCSAYSKCSVIICWRSESNPQTGNMQGNLTDEHMNGYLAPLNGHKAEGAITSVHFGGVKPMDPQNLSTWKRFPGSPTNLHLHCIGQKYVMWIVLVPKQVRKCFHLVTCHRSPNKDVRAPVGEKDGSWLSDPQFQHPDHRKEQDQHLQSPLVPLPCQCFPKEYSLLKHNVSSS